MLLVVCPNLCLDRVIVVRGFAAGKVQRAESAAELSSGKGLNVARAARALGMQVTVAGFIGAGHGGDAVVAGAHSHGITLQAVRVPGPARVCTLIIDPGHAETVINEPGPPVGEDAVRALQSHIRDGLERAQAVVLAGSHPPGVSSTFYADVIRQAPRIPVLLDATGEALRLGMAARPSLVKANHLELQEAVGRLLDAPGALADAAAEIRNGTGADVLVTRGAHGALLFAAGGTWELIPPAVERVNTIGAGDSLTAGLMAGLQRGLHLAEAARLGVAAAAADVTTLLPGTIDAGLVAQLVGRVEVRPVPGGGKVSA